MGRAECPQGPAAGSEPGFPPRGQRASWSLLWLSWCFFPPFSLVPGVSSERPAEQPPCTARARGPPGLFLLCGGRGVDPWKPDPQDRDVRPPVWWGERCGGRLLLHTGAASAPRLLGREGRGQLFGSEL